MTAPHRATFARWAAVILAVAVLISLPRVVAAIPPPAGADPSPRAVLRSINASADVPHSGYAESRGNLSLPDVQGAGDVGALLGGTSRLRVFWRGPERFRVDRLLVAGEDAIYRDPAGTWTWDSIRRQAVRLQGEAGVRLPTAVDFLPGELGRRLVGGVTAADRIQRLPADRIAGRRAVGVRITPADARTTVARVDLWADGATGIPLRVQVTARGADQRTPVLTSSYLDIDLSAPRPATLAFEPGPDASVRRERAPDLAAQADRFAPYRLPAELAGLPRTDRVDGIGGGVGTYGEGFVLVTVIPLPDNRGQDILDNLHPPAAQIVDDAEVHGASVTSPAASLLVETDTAGRYYLLAGTVGPQTLLDVAQALAADPPTRTGRR